MSEYVLLGIVFSMKILLFYFLPTMNGKGTLFGLVLNEGDVSDGAKIVLKRYRRDLLLLCLAALAAFTLANALSPKSLSFTYIIATLMIVALLFKYLRRSWNMRDKRVAARLATSLTPRNIGDFSHAWLESCLILLTLTPFAFLYYYYPLLPEMVPVHWNLAGEPDRWEPKGIFSVFFPALLGVWMQFFLLILKHDIVRAKFRVPAERAGLVLPLKEVSLAANVGLIDWCRLFAGILLNSLGFLVLSTLAAPPFLSSALNTLIWTSVILLLGGIAFYTYRMILVNREIKSLTGQITFQTAEEEAGWNGGGLYYYNPNDVAFFVEKPGGLGYTLNLAHQRTFIYLALMSAPLAFLLLDVILMKK